MAGDGPVLVGVAQVGVEAGGEVELGVEGEEPEHHLQAAALEAGPGQERVGVDVGDCELGGDAFESLLLASSRPSRVMATSSPSRRDWVT